jgi:2-keto-4-pentenoate hydratase
VLSTEQQRVVAAELRAAETGRAPVDPLVSSYPGIDVVDAYEIQLINIRARKSPVVGHKVGLSSAAMQEMMGVDEPDYGHLLAEMELRSPVDCGRYCRPRIEVEVAFVLGADLPGAGCTERDVVEATEAIAPSIELIDSRIRDWRIGLVDTVADNASSAGFLLGDNRVALSDVDIRAIDVVLRNGNDEVAAGRSDAVLGNPVTAVAWLAEKVDQFGVRLKAGDIVLPGSCTRAIDVESGQEFTASFAGLGDVSVAFK